MRASSTAPTRQRLLSAAVLYAAVLHAAVLHAAVLHAAVLYAAVLPALLVTAPGCSDQPGCDTLPPGLERDTCVHGQLAELGPEQIDQVIGLAQQIQDPMIRGAAASSWIAEYNTAVPKAKGEQLCAMLAGTDRDLCRRRLASAHLQR